MYPAGDYAKGPRAASEAFQGSSLRATKSSAAPVVGRTRCTVSKLKDASFDADETAMFLRRHEPLLLVEERIEGLCASLNRPVVSVDGLSVGPASSAIVLHGAGEGARELVIALRFEESGAVVLFEFQGSLNASRAKALDAGLTFAEGMGFLFDDDLLTGDAPTARRQALEHWCELTGDELQPAVGRTAQPVEDPLLDDILELSETLEEELAAPPAAAAATLTKFRRSAPAQPEAAAAPPTPEAPAQLGRIPIVRRRRNDSEPEAPPLLARLLSRF